MDVIAVLKNRSEVRTFDNGFQVQEFYADQQGYNQNTGEMTSNILKFQVKGDRVAMLGNFPKGERVRLFFNIRGFVFKKDDGTDGHGQSLEVWKIEAIQPAISYKQDAGNQTPLANHQQPTQSPFDEDDDLPF